MRFNVQMTDEHVLFFRPSIALANLALSRGAFGRQRIGVIGNYLGKARLTLLPAFGVKVPRRRKERDDKVSDGHKECES